MSLALPLVKTSRVYWIRLREAWIFSLNWLKVESDYKLLGVAAGAFSLDPHYEWLLRSSFSPWSTDPPLQGQPGQEDGGGVNPYPGFRSVGLSFCFVIVFLRFPLNDAGRSIVTALVARIVEASPSFTVKVSSWHLFLNFTFCQLLTCQSGDQT